MRSTNLNIALSLLALVACHVTAFQCPKHNAAIFRMGSMHRVGAQYGDHQSNVFQTELPMQKQENNRRAVIANILIGGLVISSTGADPARALVEGNPPPSKNKKSLGEEYRQGTAALSDSDDAAVIPREAYKKLPSGVIYADINPGNGEEVKQGSRVNIQWVLRRSNGYFVDSSAVSDSVPFIFTVGDPNGAIAGLDEGIRGMKSGGTRRVLIPPRLAYMEGVEDGKPGPVPAGFGPKQQMRRVMEVRKDVPGEYIFLEVKLTRVR